jgi:LacI family transcriptional regulator
MRQKLSHLKDDHSYRPPTMQEVAKVARVGLTTVSRVVNNHPSVHPSTRKKVESVVAKLGYRQNEAARLLKGHRARLIGLIVPDLSDTFFASCAHIVQGIAWQHGYMTLVASSERDSELEVQQAGLMATRMISGLLLVTSIKQADERICKLQSSGLPIVAFDRPFPELRSDAVLVENREGAEKATRHLLDHGHRHIACVGYDQDVYTIRERIEGYKAAMHEVALTSQIATSLRAPDDVRRWLNEALVSKSRPTAIFSLNHRTSGFLLEALREHNIKIPDKMAIIGFDDFFLANVGTPQITTVSQSPMDLARRSMDLLLGRIRDKGTGEYYPVKIMLPTHLIVRDSCGVHPQT